ncbi:hypothetical protein BOVA604_4875 [Bacteroides ovatus]|nr:hypothetical protein BOVA604_4875 [Bacteroides ovatus]
MWESILIKCGNTFPQNEGIFSLQLGNLFPQYMGQRKSVMKVKRRYMLPFIEYQFRYEK